MQKWNPKIIIFSSVVMTWLISEIIFFQMLPLLSMNQRSFLFFHHRILAQNTKKEVKPDDQSVFILGDSYAEGMGDWPEEIDWRKNNPAPYYSGAFIHQKTGRDVITLGQGGAGSFYGIASFPKLYFQHINRFPHFNHPDPKDFLIFFYEGNDLENTFSERGLPIQHQEFFPLKPEPFQKRMQDDLEAFHDHARPMTKYLWFLEPFPLAGFLMNSLYFHFIGTGLAGEKEAVIFETPGAILSVENIQGPAMQLSLEEKEFAVSLLGESVQYLKKQFPNSNVTLVYLASPMVFYPIHSKEVRTESYLKKRPSTFHADQVKSAHRQLVELMRTKTKMLGISFLNPTDILQEAANLKAIHGPRDWNHFNRRGQTILGEYLSSYLSDKN